MSRARIFGAFAALFFALSVLPGRAADLLTPATPAPGASGLLTSPDGAVKPGDEHADAEATLVVFNRNDRDSSELAYFYATHRHVPKDHVIGLSCPTTDEISREDFDALIADPLRKALTANLWWKTQADAGNTVGMAVSNQIRYMALMRGMPLKIAPTANYPGDKPSGPPPIGDHNEASVDSELSVLGVGQHPISGVLNNPYYRSYAAFADAKIPQMILVCRLDAPSTAIVRRMIVDSIAAEQKGLKGIAYVDARGIHEAGLEEGDKWLFNLANNARRQGIPVVLDEGPGLYPDTYPMRHTALYFGWYSENVSGPFSRPGFKFEQGAIAVHIHSFSAATLHDPVSHWCGPLLVSGAAATLGNVYEPYLDLTPHLDVFFDRLRSGYNFAESAYMSERMLSWMSTFVGDPLYRPYPVAPVLEEKNEWDLYREGSVLWFKDHVAGEAALRAAGARLHSGAIYEGLGLLDLSITARPQAIDAFEEARKQYKAPDDIIRVTIHEVGAMYGLGRHADGIALAKKLIAAYPQSDGAAVLKMFLPAEPAKK